MAEQGKPEDYEFEEKRALYIFGENVAEMPCFRNSFLYGISGGFVAGIASFMGTSRAQFSSHIGFGTFFCTTLIYWFSCRYNYSQQKFLFSQLRPAMKKQAIYEGTSYEDEARKNEK